MADLRILASQFGLPDAMNREGIAQSKYAGAELTVGLLLLIIAQEAASRLGEELLFRGLIGGWLVEKLGLIAGNTLQAVIFLLPHLLILLVASELWPLMLLVFAGGWFFGWLRYKAESIVPGWLIHILTNVASTLSVMLAATS